MSETTTPAPVSGKFAKGDEAFLQGLKDAGYAESTPYATAAIYLMLLVVAVAIAWAAIARVDEVTRVDGRIVPDGREQTIASLEGGILRSMAVREGMLVEKGQELLQLDPTRVAAQQNEGAAKRMSLRATQARLEAEATGRTLNFPGDVKVDEALTEGETEVYESRRRALNEAISVNRSSLVLLNRELFMAERMSSKGLMSEVEVMRLRRQVNDLQLQVQERINRFRQDASSELMRVRSELAQLDEQMVVKQDVLQRTTLYSPVRGYVKHIKIGTIGGVVAGGATIMEIVPVGQKVLIEARIKPSDIGFVRVGSSAEVKLLAYDYYTYGGLKGVVEYISPDALGEDGKTGPQDTSYYRALIRSEASTLKAKGTPLQVIPGMTATVEIRTGERSVLQFLLKPMLKSQEAFRER